MVKPQNVCRPYSASDSASATECLVCAFDEDPLMRAMVRACGNHSWDEFAPVMFSWTNYMLHSSFGMTDVVVSDTGEVLCTAGWELPSMTVMMGLRGLVFLVYMLFWDGFTAVKMYIRVMTIMEGKRHALAPGAHHLQVLGAKVQGKGVGSMCIRVGIERANKAGADCYLESSNPKNIPFYQRHGFKILETIYPLESDGEKGPVATLMLRKCDHSKKKA